MNPPTAIIGAGPAGSAAALLLARKGHRVTLIEQHRFPRDKVCGECLSATGIAALERMGLTDRLRRLGPTVLTGAAVHGADGSSFQLPLPRPMWGISRAAFDSFLIGAASEAGATVLQPARCEAILSGAPVRLRIRRTGCSESETMLVEQAIVADGKGALGGAPPVRTDDFGIKAHFENVDGPRDVIELFGCDGLYGGLAAVEGNRWNAAFSVPAARLRRHRGDLAAVFAQIAKENRTLSRRVAGARRVSDWIAAPLPRFSVRMPGNGGTIPVGNAAAALEPIGGEGMGLALRSAELLAHSIDTADRPQPPHVLAGTYRALWRVRRPACRLAASIVSRPVLAARLLQILRGSGPLAEAALRLMGK